MVSSSGLNVAQIDLCRHNSAILKRKILNTSNLNLEKYNNMFPDRKDIIIYTKT